MKKFKIKRENYIFVELLEDLIEKEISSRFLEEHFSKDIYLTNSPSCEKINFELVHINDNIHNNGVCNRKIISKITLRNTDHFDLEIVYENETLSIDNVYFWNKLNSEIEKYIGQDFFLDLEFSFYSEININGSDKLIQFRIKTSIESTYFKDVQKYLSIEKLLIESLRAFKHKMNHEVMDYFYKELYSEEHGVSKEKLKKNCYILKDTKEIREYLKIN